MTDLIKNSSLRVGRFTGSKISALLSMGSREMTPTELIAWKAANPKSTAKMCKDGLGTAALTYIDEKNMERRLERSLFDVSNAKPLTWGKVMEGRVFELLGMEYELCSTTTLQHPDIDWWCGSPDAIKHDTGQTVGDIKCPITLKSFCTLVDPLYAGLSGLAAMYKIRDKHESGEDYYWQLVNNAILTKSQFAELIVYCPYYSELPDIREYAKFPDDIDSKKYYWIAYGSDDELPYLVDDGYYSNINKIRFEVPQSDIEQLTKRVIEAGAMLEPFRK